MLLSSVIEGILFVAGGGVSVEYLAEKLDESKKNVETALAELEKKYSGSSGVHLIKYKANYQFSTNPEYVDKISDVLTLYREKMLTRAALETLAIIAYKQPVTRVEIEAIRGVDSSYATQVLLQNNLIKVLGRKDTIGKPIVLGTTDEFLKRFELEDIDKLPSYEDLLEKIKLIQSDDFYEGAKGQVATEEVSEQSDDV